MSCEYFEPLFRLCLVESYGECEREVMRILEDRSNLSPVSMMMLTIFSQYKKYTLPFDTEQPLKELLDMKQFFLGQNCYEGAFLTARLISTNFVREGNFTLANEFNKECFKYNASLDEKYYSLTYAKASRISMIIADTSREVPEGVLEYSRLALEKAGSDPVFLAVVYSNFGYALQLTERWDEMLEATHRFHGLVVKENLTQLMKYVNELYYFYYIGVKNYEKAIEYCKIALEQGVESGDESVTGAALCNLGAAYARNVQYDEAIASTIKAYEIERKLGSRAEVVESTKNIVEFALAKAGLDSIRPYFTEFGSELEKIYEEKYKTEFNKETSDMLMESLKKERQHEKQANQMKSDFLANMSHEIRTPMNAITGMTELILRSHSIDEAKEYARSIKSASKSLLTIINDILDFSKIEAGKLEINPAAYQLSSVLNDIANIAAIRIGEKPIEFVIDADKSLPFELYGDEIRIKQILLNFINNAIKFTQHGKVVLQIRGIKESDEAIKLHIRVMDTGNGIKSEDLQKLFMAFSQVDTTKNRAVEGTGLGLAICKRLTELMGGEVSVESEYGRGSTFSVVIPQRILNPTPMGDFVNLGNGQALSSFEIDSIAPHAKVLIVDDNEVNLSIAKGLLAPYKMNVSTVTSAAECFAFLQKEHFNIIFMDHMMPVMDGVEAVEKIRKTDTETPIIALTANAIGGAREIYLQNGFQDYLTKPIDVIELNTILLKYLPDDLVMKVESSSHRKHTLGDEVLRSIYLEGRKKLPLIRKLFHERNLNGYVIEVHALKSVAAAARQSELSEIAKAHEEAGRAGKWNIIEESFDSLIMIYQDWIDSLARFDETQADAPEDLDDILQDEIDRLFGQIVEAAEEFEMDGVNEAAKKLNGVKLSQGEMMRLRSICEAAESLDYHVVAEAARNA